MNTAGVLLYALTCCKLEFRVPYDLDLSCKIFLPLLRVKSWSHHQVNTAPLWRILLHHYYFLVLKKWLPLSCEVSWLLSLVKFSWYVYSIIWIYCRMTEKKKLIYHLLIVLFSYQVFRDTYLPISTKKLVVQIGFGMLYWLLVYFQVIYESADLLHRKNRGTTLYERGHRLDVKRRQHSIPAPPLL